MAGADPGQGPAGLGAQRRPRRRRPAAEGRRAVVGRLPALVEPPGFDGAADARHRRPRRAPRRSPRRARAAGRRRPPGAARPGRPRSDAGRPAGTGARRAAARGAGGRPAPVEAAPGRGRRGRRRSEADGRRRRQRPGRGRRAPPEPPRRRRPAERPPPRLRPRSSNASGPGAASTHRRWCPSTSWPCSESRLVVLAGPSGTGKTRLALEAAAELGAVSCLVAVRPDWHANEDLLGYLPPFPGSRFSSTAASEFIRSASIEAEAAAAEQRTPRPFHLCLDEMNLARPEHYLAELLSKMEVPGGKVSFHTGGTEAGFPPEVAYPPNLVIIGTVNLDETTLPISAKILDRAAYLVVEAHDLRGFLDTLPGDGVGPGLDPQAPRRSRRQPRRRRPGPRLPGGAAAAAVGQPRRRRRAQPGRGARLGAGRPGRPPAALHPLRPVAPRGAGSDHRAGSGAPRASSTAPRPCSTACWPSSAARTSPSGRCACRDPNHRGGRQQRAAPRRTAGADGRRRRCASTRPRRWPSTSAPGSPAGSTWPGCRCRWSTGGPTPPGSTSPAGSSGWGSSTSSWSSPARRNRPSLRPRIVVLPRRATMEGFAFLVDQFRGWAGARRPGRPRRPGPHLGRARPPGPQAGRGAGAGGPGPAAAGDPRPGGHPPGAGHHPVRAARVVRPRPHRRAAPAPAPAPSLRPAPPDPRAALRPGGHDRRRAEHRPGREPLRGRGRPPPGRPVPGGGEHPAVARRRPGAGAARRHPGPGRPGRRTALARPADRRRCPG